MRIWLDDYRPAPEYDKVTGRELPKWTVVKTSAECIKLVETGGVKFISFDHDLLGDDTGYKVAMRIEELAAAGKIPPIDYAVHSGNPVGAKRIDQAMKSAWRFWEQRKGDYNGTPEKR